LEFLTIFKIEKKKAKIMNFTQYVLDFNEELQNEKVFFSRFICFKLLVEG